MPNTINLEDCIYIPKITDSIVVNSGINYPYVLMDAHTVFASPNVYATAVEKFPIIVDPVTNFLQYNDKRLTPSYQKLSYSSVEDVAKIHADPIYRQNEFVKPVIDFQLSLDSSTIIAPYLCAEDVHNTIFTTNLALIAETINDLKHKNITLPLLAPVCIGTEAVQESLSANALVDFYTDSSILEGISGYYLMFSGFDDKTAKFPELIAISKLVYELSQYKPVFVKQVGAFGLILNAISGASFSGSAAGGETFSLKAFTNKFARQRNHKEIMYIPELLDYVNEFELSPSRIDYECDCDACQNQTGFNLTKTQQRKLHFLLRREVEVEKLRRLNRNAKILKLSTDIKAAGDLANQYIQQFRSDLETAHIHKWSDVLSQASVWDFSRDQSELDRLLAELDIP